MQTRDEQIKALEKDWAENPRWANVKRGYSAADVVRLHDIVGVGMLLAGAGLQQLRHQPGRPLFGVGRRRGEFVGRRRGHEKSGDRERHDEGLDGKGLERGQREESRGGFRGRRRSLHGAKLSSSPLSRKRRSQC